MLDRYLAAVGTFLPAKAQEDILRELSENIRCQLEEKEAELGRPLSEAEEEQVIKQHGHPVGVAARYRRPQYLISPSIFPFYWLTLKIAVAGALVVRLIVAIVTALISADPPHAIVPALLAVPFVLVPVFCWVTGAFAALEICSSFLDLRCKAEWSPRSLPAVRNRWPAIPRAESVAQIIFGSAVVLWWQAQPSAPYLVFGPAANLVALGTIWTTLHWPILLLTLAGVAQACVDWARPHPTNLRAAVRLSIRAAGLVILCIILRAGNWVVLAPGVRDPAKYTSLLSIVNQVFFYCFLVGLVIAAGSSPGTALSNSVTLPRALECSAPADCKL